MTVENTNNTISYTGNGSVDTFAYNFLTYSESHIFIYFDDVLQSIGYTVEDVGDEGGGNIVFDAPPDTGVIIRIDRTVPDTQLIEYQEYGPFPAKANERGLDLLTMAVQQNAREIGRDSERIDVAKMDKQPIADTDNIIIFDSEGNSKDSGKKITDIERSGGSYVNELPPTFPNQGDRWTRCTDMKGFIWYVDEDSGQWVEDRPSYVLPSESGEVISVNGKDGDVVLTTNDINDSASLNKYTTEEEKTKLLGIEDNATANSSDATLLNRANHTGTQAANTISDFESTVSSNTDVAANNAKVSFPEAPNDSKQYARKNLGWEEVSGGGGGGFTVTTFTGGGEMVLGAVNELQDGDTSYTLPPANSGSADEYLIITQTVDKAATFNPVVTVDNNGTETIIIANGTDTSIDFDQSNSTDIRCTTDGISQWRLTV
jgi:hypothetical protein